MASPPRRQNRLISLLSPDEQSRLAPHFSEVELATRTTLCTTGARITHVTFPLDGVTSTLTDLPEGDSVEVGLTGWDGMVGVDLLLGGSQSSSTVIVQIPGYGLRMKADVFVNEVVTRRGPFYTILLRYARVFFAMVAQSGACNASHSLEQRLARWLLMCHDRLQRDRFPLTHEFLAFMLAVRRATVTEAAHALRGAGAISYERGEMTIVDRKILEGSSCGCYEAVRALTEAAYAHDGEAAS